MLYIFEVFFFSKIVPSVKVVSHYYFFLVCKWYHLKSDLKLKIQEILPKQAPFCHTAYIQHT